MGAVRMRVQTADINIIIHTTPVYQLEAIRGNSLKLQCLKDGFVSYRHSWSLQDVGLEWCGLFVDYCDVFDGTHSLQRFHWQTSDGMLNFSKKEESFSLALNGGGRFLSSSSPLSSLLCSLVSWETLSALLSKLKYYGLTGLLMQLTLSKLGFRGTWLPWRNVRSRLYDGRVGEVANRVSGGSFRGGHWYLPFRNHDNRYFAD